MRKPQDNLRWFVDRGKQLQVEASNIAAKARLSQYKVQTGVGLLDHVFDLGGHKRLAASAGKYIVFNGLIERSRALSISFEQWYSEVLSQLRTISVARKNVMPRGNSSSLTARFAKAKMNKRLDTRIIKAVGILEAILEEELVYNDDIRELLGNRRREAEEEAKRASREQLLDLSTLGIETDFAMPRTLEDIHQKLVGHPKVAKIIEGAIDAYSSRGADSNRQSLASCRSALELLVREVTGESRWREGLGSIAEGSRKKLISSAYAFLSGYGSHPGGEPVKADVEYGIRVTIACCLWLVGH